MDLLAAVILAGAFVLALWGAWRPHYRAASYLGAAIAVAGLAAALAVTGQITMIIVSAGALAVFAPLLVINQRRAQRRQ
jgi:hypothetical protein